MTKNKYIAAFRAKRSGKQPSREVKAAPPVAPPPPDVSDDDLERLTAPDAE
jgi:hypothetical protein